jgi:type II secretion system protein H
MMTLATGQPSNSRGRRRGTGAFTLIELILVMALLVVVISIVAPRLSGFVRGRALDAEARRLLALAHAGQSRAVSEGMPVLLWVDEKQAAYGMESESPATGGDPRAEQLTMGEGLQLVVLNAGTGAQTKLRGLPAIRFLADGAVDENSPQAVEITDGNGGALWLVENESRTGYEISATK